MSVDEWALIEEYQRLGLTLDQLFEQVFFSYNRYLVAYLRRRRWDEAIAEDILQSAWIILWNNAKQGAFFQRVTDGRMRTKKPMLAYLVKTCEYLARNMHRHQCHFPEVPFDEVAQQQDGTVLGMGQTDTQLTYDRLMFLAGRVCTPDEQRVLDLLALGLDRCEIAGIAGQKPHWVDNRRRAACRKIRAALKRRRKGGAL